MKKACLPIIIICLALIVGYAASWTVERTKEHNVIYSDEYIKKSQLEHYIEKQIYWAINNATLTVMIDGATGNIDRCHVLMNENEPYIFPQGCRVMYNPGLITREVN